MLRAWPWLVISLTMLVLMMLAMPTQAPALTWNLGKVTLGVWAGYWADRNLFPYGRPDQLQGRGSQLFALAMLRRALIVAAVVVGLGLGV